MARALRSRPWAAALASLLLTAPAAARPHGGFYAPPPVRGPVTPPGVPGPAGPGTPRGPGGLPGPGAASTTATANLDVESWEHWWRANGPGFLEVRARVHANVTLSGPRPAPGTLAGVPDLEELRGRIVPELLAALGAERAADLRTAALMALGKLARQLDDATAQEVVRALLPHLADGSQEVAETAAVALGLAARDDALPLLLGLLADDARGRAAVRKGEVPYRTRAFAAYGLGLYGARHPDNAMRQRIVEAPIAILEETRLATYDVHVAALSALGRVPLDLRASVPPRADGQAPGPHARHALSRRAQLDYLLAYLTVARASEDRRPELARAHAALALGRLSEGVPPRLRELVLEGLLAHLAPRADEDDLVRESVVLALGELAHAGDGAPDERVRARLLELLEGGEPMEQRYAAMALARVAARPGPPQGDDDASWAGTAAVRRALLRRMASGPTRVRPWIGLALGVLGHGLAAHGSAPDDGASAALRAALADCKRPQDLGAYALAVALRKDVRAAASLRDKLRSTTDPPAQGHLVVALGSLGRPEDVATVRALLDSSVTRPELLSECAVALALLGDPGVEERLLAELARARSLAGQAALASALGRVGTRRAVLPLLDMLADRQHLTDGARAFAAVALGLVASDALLPWNHPYAAGLHTLATPPTLSDGSAGILDIL